MRAQEGTKNAIKRSVSPFHKTLPSNPNAFLGEPNANGVEVKKLIFNEESLDPETELISDKLATVNKRGILTVNSQPSVNCAPSNDSRVGWGPPGGFVFQKAYLEFFTCEDNVIALMQVNLKMSFVQILVILCLLFLSNF